MGKNHIRQGQLIMDSGKLSGAEQPFYPPFIRIPPFTRLESQKRTFDGPMLHQIIQLPSSLLYRSPILLSGHIRYTAFPSMLEKAIGPIDRLSTLCSRLSPRTKSSFRATV